MKLNGDEKILIIKPSAIGDILHSMPFLYRLKKVYPNIKVSWVVNREYADLLEGNELIDKIYIFERKKWGKKRSFFYTLKEFFNFTNEIKNNKYDLVIDLQGLLRSGLITYLAGVKKRIGLSDSREFSRLFYNHIVNVCDKKRHAVDRYLLVSSYIGIDGIHTKQIRFPIKWGVCADKKIDKFFENNKINNGDLKIAINPISRWQSKCWIPEKYAQLADYMIESMGAKVIFVGAKSDQENVNRILGLMKNKPISAVGETSLQELAALLKRMDLMVTNDSGPMHMAVAVDIPVVAIFGPTDPQLTGPYGDNNFVLKKTTKCNTCFKKTCKYKYCMNLISVEEVVSAIQILIEKSRTGIKSN